jgi:hypothetical protein
MSQNENPKPMRTTQQKESYGKEILKNSKAKKASFKESITVEKVN